MDILTKTTTTGEFKTHLDKAVKVHHNGKHKNYLVKETVLNQWEEVEKTNSSSIAYSKDVIFEISRDEIIQNFYLRITNTAFGGTTSTSAITNCIESISYLNGNDEIAKYSKQQIAAFIYYLQENKSNIATNFNLGTSKVASTTEIVPLYTPWDNTLFLKNDEKFLASFGNTMKNLRIKITIVGQASDWATSDGTVALPSEMMVLKNKITTFNDDEILKTYINNPMKIYGDEAIITKSWTQSGTTLSTLKIDIDSILDTNINGFICYFSNVSSSSEFLSIDSGIDFGSLDVVVGNKRLHEYKSSSTLKMENYEKFHYFIEDGMYYVPLVQENDSLNKSKMSLIKFDTDLKTNNLEFKTLTGLTDTNNYTLFLIPVTIKYLEIDSIGKDKEYN